MGILPRSSGPVTPAGGSRCLRPGRWVQMAGGPPPRTDRRARDGRGAAAVEFALLAPLLITLLFGIVSGGITYYRGVSVNNAAREAARFGSTLVIDGDLAGWLDSVADTAISASNGAAAPDAPGQYVCVAFVHPDGAGPHDQTARIVETAGVRGPVEVGSTCVSDGRPPSEARVQVVVRRNSDIGAIMFDRTIGLAGETVARYDRVGSL